MTATMPAAGPSVLVSATDVVIELAPLRVEIALRPFTLTVRRGVRRLLRGGGVWVAEGQVNDQFIHLTEGVIAREQRSSPERAWRATVSTCETDAVELALTLSGGRVARLRVGVPSGDRVELQLDADGTPLRLGIDWEQRAEERLVGLGARHNTRLDQAGRTVQLGADRRYTGPDCPTELLEQGGIPQGDCAPMPWLVSSRGYSVWVHTDANGTQFDLSGELVAISTRAAAGPLRMDVLCAATPAARLRAFCGLTGFAAVLPEWGYGFWKSRDFHEHRDDVLEDLEGFRRHRIPLDAIVIDSPWETQYNTWEFNPHQFPDARGMVATLRAAGVRTVLWITPWVRPSILRRR